MNSIVTLIDGEAVTTSLDIAEGTGVQHKNVLELIRKNVSDFETFGQLAFEMRVRSNRPQGGTGLSTQVAQLNERQATLLMTYMRNSEVVRKFKIRLVKLFYEMANKKLDPTNLSREEILLMALDSEQTKLRLEHKVEELKPKAEFHDKVVASEDAISVGEAAKLIGTGRNRLLTDLRREGWVTRKNEPYQSVIESGLMDVKLGQWKHPSQGLKSTVTALVTGKGLAKLQIMYAA